MRLPYSRPIKYAQAKPMAFITQRPLCILRFRLNIMMTNLLNHVLGCVITLSREELTL